MPFTHSVFHKIFTMNGDFHPNKLSPVLLHNGDGLYFPWSRIWIAKFYLFVIRSCCGSGGWSLACHFRGPGSISSQYMGFVVNRVPLGKVYFRVQRLCSLKAIQPMHHTHLDHNIILSEGQEGHAWEPTKLAVFFEISKSTVLTSTSTLSQLVHVYSG